MNRQEIEKTLAREFSNGPGYGTANSWWEIARVHRKRELEAIGREYAWVHRFIWVAAVLAVVVVSLAESRWVK